jgi:hypothetical protein
VKRAIFKIESCPDIVLTECSLVSICDHYSSVLDEYVHYGTCCHIVLPSEAKHRAEEGKQYFSTWLWVTDLKP